MNCKVIALDNFKRDAKKLLKKYASLKEELTQLQLLLLSNPRYGTLIRENVYKIRLAVKSKGKGKSGGMRVITFVFEVEVLVEEDKMEQDFTVFLMTIYDKSDMENISDKDLQNLVDEIINSLNDEEPDNK